MTTLTRKARSRIGRLFIRLGGPKKSRSRWYEVENCGVH